MYSLGTTKFLFAELKGIYKLSDNGSIGHRTSDLVPGMKVKGLAALFSSFASWKFTKIKFKLTEFIKKYLPTKKPNNSSKMGFQTQESNAMDVGGVERLLLASHQPSLQF